MLQERQFERLGDTQTISVDTRVIAASNRDLQEEIKAGRFRDDLYYRLNVVPIRLPPLRERREDIPELVVHFLDVYNEENDRYVSHIAPDALEALQQYHWPGNVRELQNYVERAVVMADGDELTCELLPEEVTGAPRQPAGQLPGADLETLTFHLVQEGLNSSRNGEEGKLHAKIVKRVERELVLQVMSNCDRVQTKAATKLGINRNTLHKKLKEYGIEGS